MGCHSLEGIYSLFEWGLQSICDSFLMNYYTYINLVWEDEVTTTSDWSGLFVSLDTPGPSNQPSWTHRSEDGLPGCGVTQYVHPQWVSSCHFLKYRYSSLSSSSEYYIVVYFSGPILFYPLAISWKYVLLQWGNPWNSLKIVYLHCPWICM